MTPDERAQRYVSWDGSSTRSKRVAAYPPGVGGYALRGHGARLETADGRTLIDWMGSLGATPLGYQHPRVVEAIQRQLEDGPIFSFPHVLEGQIAERICTEVATWAEQVKFVKTGSEACAAAVRIARAATGRDFIMTLRGHYHGWHDTFAILAEDHPGVPEVDDGWRCEPIHAGDPDLRRIEMECQPEQYAAVIVEPATRSWIPTREWLQELVELAHQYGTLVIFDEMLTGGRLSLSGGSGYFDVTPDLATYGKVFGGGLPLAFVVGRRELMEHAAYVSGTYSGECLSLSACGAVLDVYRDEDPISRLWEIGREAQAWFGATTGLPPLFAVDRPAAVVHALVQACARQGVLYHPSYVAPCAAMTEADVQRSAKVTRWALEEVAAGPCVPLPVGTGMRA